LDRMKSRFVSNVSHELRTPVTTIKLYAGLLQRSPRDRTERYLNSLVQEANRLAQLVEDILQISRIDAGRLIIKPKSIALNRLTEATVMHHQVLAQTQNLMLSHNPMEPSPIALVDAERIMQVLNNLVENAIRYTLEGGEIVVATDTAESNERLWALVKVSDTGIGIPEDELSSIFKRFFRGVTPQQMQVPGTGLGLAIVKEIVELHGGQITVESRAGEGTTFSVWLPLA